MLDCPQMTDAPATNGFTPSGLTQQVRSLMAAPDPLLGVEVFVGALEIYGQGPKDNPRVITPSHCRFIVANLELVRQFLAVHILAHDVGVATTTPDRVAKLEDLRDRIEEMIDSFRWGAEAAEELRDIVDEELCR
jgi:hypothetical protein